MRLTNGPDLSDVINGTRRCRSHGANDEEGNLEEGEKVSERERQRSKESENDEQVQQLYPLP